MGKMGKLRVAIGSDKEGYAAKEAIKDYLNINRDQYAFTDFGVESMEQEISASYIAIEIAKAISSGEYERGIIVDRFGIDTTIAANKVNGVRAVGTMLSSLAEKSVEYYNANVLCLGADINMGDRPEDIANIWLKAKFRK